MATKDIFADLDSGWKNLMPTQTGAESFETTMSKGMALVQKLQVAEQNKTMKSLQAEMLRLKIGEKNAPDTPAESMGRQQELLITSNPIAYANKVAAANGHTSYAEAPLDIQQLAYDSMKLALQKTNPMAWNGVVTELPAPKMPSKKKDNSSSLRENIVDPMVGALTGAAKVPAGWLGLGELAASNVVGKETLLGELAQKSIKTSQWVGKQLLSDKGAETQSLVDKGVSMNNEAGATMAFEAIKANPAYIPTLVAREGVAFWFGGGGVKYGLSKAGGAILNGVNKYDAGAELAIKLSDWAAKASTKGTIAERIYAGVIGKTIQKNAGVAAQTGLLGAGSAVTEANTKANEYLLSQGIDPQSQAGQEFIVSAQNNAAGYAGAIGGTLGLVMPGAEGLINKAVTSAGRRELAGLATNATQGGVKGAAKGAAGLTFGTLKAAGSEGIEEYIESPAAEFGLAKAQGKDPSAAQILDMANPVEAFLGAIGGGGTRIAVGGLNVATRAADKRNTDAVSSEQKAQVQEQGNKQQALIDNLNSTSQSVVSDFFKSAEGNTVLAQIDAQTNESAKESLIKQARKPLKTAVYNEILKNPEFANSLDVKQRKDLSLDIDEQIDKKFDAASFLTTDGFKERMFALQKDGFAVSIADNEIIVKDVATIQGAMNQVLQKYFGDSVDKKTLSQIKSAEFADALFQEARAQAKSNYLEQQTAGAFEAASAESAIEQTGESQLEKAIKVVENNPSNGKPVKKAIAFIEKEIDALSDAGEYDKAQALEDKINLRNKEVGSATPPKPIAQPQITPQQASAELQRRAQLTLANLPTSNSALSQQLSEQSKTEAKQESVDGGVPNLDGVPDAALDDVLTQIGLEEKARAKIQSTNLNNPNFLRLTKSELFEINPSLNVFYSRKNGIAISSRVADGDFDAWLPPAMRHDSSKFDEIDSTNTIKDYLAQILGNSIPFYDYETRMQIKQANVIIEQLQTQLNELESTNEINTALASYAESGEYKQWASELAEEQFIADSKNSDTGTTEAKPQPKNEPASTELTLEQQTPTDLRAKSDRESAAPLFSQSNNNTKPTNPSTATAVRSAIEGIFGNNKGVWDSISKSTSLITEADIPELVKAKPWLESIASKSVAGQQGDLLTAYSRDEALSKQAREEQASKEAAKAAPAVRGKSFKTEQVDLFNPQGGLFSKGRLGNAQALYDPRTGNIYLVTDRIQKGTEAAVWLHEVSHKQLLPLLGKESLSKLNNAVTSWRGRKEGTVERAIYKSANSRAEKAANELVQADKETIAQFKARKQELYNAEFLAYAIEEAVRRGVTPDAKKGTISAQGWMAKVKQLFQSALEKLIGKPSELTANDLVAMAYGAAQLELQGKNAGGNGNVQASLTPFDGKEQAKTPLGDTKTVTVDGTEYSVFNSLGKPIHPTVEGVRNFWRWYQGIKTKSGRPVELYHATINDFSVFDETKSDLGIHIGTKKQANELVTMRGGVNPENVSFQIMPVYINIKNPLRLKDKSIFHAHEILDQLIKLKIITEEKAVYISDNVADNWRLAKLFDADIRDVLISKGYDGIVYENKYEGSGDSYIAFNSNQIKSATGNNGDFSPTNNDIRLSIAPSNPVSSAKVAEINRKISAATGVIDRIKATSQKPAELAQLSKDYKNGGKLWLQKHLLNGIDLRSIAYAWRGLFTVNGKNILQDVVDLANERGGKVRAALVDLDNKQVLDGKSLVQLYQKNINAKELWSVMDTATVLDYDPSSKAPTGNDERQLYTEYNKLSPEQKAIYKETLKKFREQWKRTIDLLVGQVKTSGLTEAKQKAAIGKLQETGRSVYFAQERFGDYVNTVKDKDGSVLWFSRHETNAEANLIRERLVTEYGNERVEPTGVFQQQNRRQLDGATQGYVSDVIKALESKEGYSPAQIASIESLMGEVLNKTKINKTNANLQKRKNIAGATLDGYRANINAIRQGEMRNYTLEYQPQINKALQQVRDYANDRNSPLDADGRKAAQQIADHMAKTVSYVNEGGPFNAVASTLSTYGFVHTMWGNISTAIINATNLLTVGAPTLGAEYGYTNAVTEMSKSATEVTGFLSQILLGKKEPKGDFKTVFDYAQKIGMLQYGDAREVYDIARNTGAFANGLQKAIQFGAMPMEKSEEFTNLTIMLAAYRMGVANGLDSQAALEAARDARYKINPDNASDNKSYWARAPLGRVAMQLKGYGIAMATMLYADSRDSLKIIRDKAAGREVNQSDLIAAKRLAGVISMHALLSGVAGVPFLVASPMLALAYALSGGLDDEDDLPVADYLKNRITDAYGESVTRTLFSGVLGEGVSARVSIDNLIIDTKGSGSPSQEADDLFKKLMGPSIGGIWNGYKNYKMYSADEKTAFDSIKTSIPASAANILKSYELYTDDGQSFNKSGNPLLKENLSNVDMLKQMIGLRPADLAFAKSQESAIRQDIAKIDAQRRLALNLYRDVVMLSANNKDTEAALEMYNTVKEVYNGKYPEYQIDEKAEATAKKRALNSNDERLVSLSDKKHQQVSGRIKWAFTE